MKWYLISEETLDTFAWALEDAAWEFDSGKSLADEFLLEEVLIEDEDLCSGGMTHVWERYNGSIEGYQEICRNCAVLS